MEKNHIPSTIKVIDLDSPEFVNKSGYIHYRFINKDGKRVDVKAPVSRILQGIEDEIQASIEQEKKHQEWLNNRSNQVS